MASCWYSLQQAMAMPELFPFRSTPSTTLQQKHHHVRVVFNAACEPALKYASSWSPSWRSPSPAPSSTVSVVVRAKRRSRTRRAPMRHRRSISVAASAQQAPPSMEEEITSSSVMVQELVEFLREDLTHLFDEQGISKEKYESRVDFRDPITRYSSLDGYLLNITMLRYLFSPKFELHDVKQTGPSEITTRWTMTMRFALLPWRPELVFTGTSVMGVNPATGKFLSHVDYWDSLKDNDYFSFEGVIDLLKQLKYYRTPDLQTPKYRVLKRTKVYEVREYEPFIVVEAQGDRLTGTKGFKYVTEYIFGNNSTREKIPMTTPVITKTSTELQSDVAIQIVLPLASKISSLPTPMLDLVKINEVGGGFITAIKFSGEATEEAVSQKEGELRSALVEDKLNAKSEFMLARYNDPGRTWSFIRRNEVLIALEDFKLE